MKKMYLIFLMVFLAACAGSSQAQQLPTPVGAENSLVSINEDNYEVEIRSIISNVSNYNPELGKILLNCEVGTAVPDGYKVSFHGDGKTCLVLYVPSNLSNMKLLKDFAPPSDSNQGFTVALTQDIVGFEYPFIFVGEREFDFFYLTRVFAHEGIHMVNIRNQTTCETSICEEVNAYKVQFKVLEEMYPQDLLNSGVKSYALSDSGELLLRALDMENFLYQKYKEGKLEQTLQEMSYGTN